MAKIRPGQYTVREVFEAADFDHAEKLAADYNDGGPDFRKVKVGGLDVHSLDDLVSVPVTADTLDISLDGSVDSSLDVELSADDEKARAASFEDASGVDDPRAASSKSK